MSNEILVRIQNIVMSKVSNATFVGVGLVGPKARPNGVVDGQQVNIPVLLFLRYYLRRDDAGQFKLGDEVAESKLQNSHYR